MAEYVTGINTNQGEKKIDYNYLANKLKTKDGSEDGYLISAEDKGKLDNAASNDELINLQNEINTMQTNITNTFDTKVDKSTFNSTVSNLSSNIDSKAQTNHSSTATTYGIANKDYYGHVKLSDNYSGSMLDPATGVAASTKAVNDLAGEVQRLTDGNVIEVGAWTPSISFKKDGRINSSICYYQKIGHTVTISFFIDGQGDSIDAANTADGKYLKITEDKTLGSKLPAPTAHCKDNSTDVLWYGGGGHAHGLKRASGFYFSGFTISPNGEIRARSISNDNDANYLFVTNGGQQFYIAGTIMYVTDS